MSWKLPHWVGRKTSSSLDAVGDKVLDGDDLEAEAVGHFLQLGHTCHSAVVVDDLDEGAGGLEASETGEVDSGLGMAGAHQDAAVACPEGVDMAWAAKVLGAGGGVGQSADGRGAVVHRDACGAAVEQVVDSNGEGGSQQRGVVVDLHIELQLVAALLGDGGAEDTAAVFEHKVDVFGGDFLGGHDKVALVLTVFVVDHNNEAALAEILDGLFDGVQFKIHFFTSIRVSF